MTDSPAPDPPPADSLQCLLPPPPAYLRARSRTPDSAVVPEPVLALTTTATAPPPAAVSPTPPPPGTDAVAAPASAPDVPAGAAAVVLRARERPAPPASACFLCMRARARCVGGVPCERCRLLGVPHMCITAESIYSRAAARSTAQTRAASAGAACPSPSAAATAVAATTAAPPEAVCATSQVDPVYVMRELAAMKREQRKLLEDMELLRYQNEKLERSLETAKREVSCSQQSLKEMEAQQRELFQQQQQQQQQQPQPLPCASDASEVGPPFVPYAPLPKKRRSRTGHVPPLPQAPPPSLQQEEEDVEEQQEEQLEPLRRKRRRRALQQQAVQQQQGALFPAVDGLAVIVYDLLAKPPRVCHVSPAVGALLGTAPADMLGAPWFRLVHRSLVPQTLAAMDKVVRTGAPAQTTELYQHRGGGFIQTTDTHNVVFDTAGRPHYDVVNIVPLRDPLVYSTPAPPAPPAVPAVPALLPPHVDSRLYAAAAHSYGHGPAVPPAWACPAVEPATAPADVEGCAEAGAYSTSPVPQTQPQQPGDTPQGVATAGDSGVPASVGDAPDADGTAGVSSEPVDSGGGGGEAGPGSGPEAQTAGAAAAGADTAAPPAEPYYDLFATSDPTSGSDDTPPQPYGVTPAFYGYPYN